MTTKSTSGDMPGKDTPKKIATGSVSTTATRSELITDSNQIAFNFDTDEKEKKPLRTGSKIETMLRVFLSGKNLNRFEAEDHHDHCLHSTVSTLQNGFGIKIARKSETVPCMNGRSSVRCMRYWLDTAPDNLAAARALLSVLGAIQ